MEDLSDCFNSFKDEQSTLEIKDLEINGYNLKIVQYSCISSTMNVTEKLLEMFKSKSESFPNNLIIAVQALEQTQGKGQGQNKWFSPVGNLYITYFYKKTLKNPADSFLMGPLATVSTVKTLKEPLGKDHAVGIKWMNDVIVNNKKISGALTRTASIGDDCFVQMGIGINVNVVPQSQISTATCLKDALNSNEEIALQTIMDGLTKNLLELLSNLQKQQINQIYKESVIYLQQKVYIYDPTLKNIIQKGVFQELDDNLFPLLKLEGSGEVVTVQEGRMRQGLVETTDPIEFLTRTKFRNELGSIIEFKKSEASEIEFNVEMRTAVGQPGKEETFYGKGVVKKNKHFPFQFFGITYFIDWGVYGSLASFTGTGNYEKNIFETLWILNSCQEKESDNIWKQNTINRNTWSPINQ